MAGITLEQAEAQLALYLEAETKVLAKQEYEIAGRKMTFADLEAIQAGIRVWEDRVQRLSRRASGRGRSYTVVT